MSNGWVGEIVKYRGHLWDVEYERKNQGEDGRVWLGLRDHYGSGATTTAWAEDVEVALQ